ncbi:MAG: hypothetical protein R2771_16365 [Saprospiraceae bacterium]
MKLSVNLFILSFVILFSCKSQEPKFEDYSGKYISIGKGGGFSGLYSGFYLFEDGRVFSFNTLNNEKLYIGKLEENTAKQFFVNYNFLELKDKNVNSPGNMNYFIEYKDGKEVFKSLWSMENKDEQLSLYYKTLLGQLSKL